MNNIKIKLFLVIAALYITPPQQSLAQYIPTYNKGQTTPSTTNQVPNQSIPASNLQSPSKKELNINEFNQSTFIPLQPEIYENSRSFYQQPILQNDDNPDETTEELPIEQEDETD